jgi:predicted dinucleotide-binding enzyme
MLGVSVTASLGAGTAAPAKAEEKKVEEKKEDKLTFGILGSGDVGKALAIGLVAKGYGVRIGTREPTAEKLVKWQAEAGKGVTFGTFEDTAAYGKIIVLATLWSGTQNAIELAKKTNFAGKTVLDATNPLRFSAAGPELTVGHTDSGGETVQKWIPDAHVIKCFNIIGNAHMVNPDFKGQKPDMFICGNNADAKTKVKTVLNELGWTAEHVIDIGDITGSRLLEPMCILWVKYGFATKTWNHAFALLRK